MAPNTLGPVTLIQYSLLIKNEIVSIKIPLECPLGILQTQALGLGRKIKVSGTLTPAL